MKATGFIRGYMAKNLDEEKFLHHVVGVIEQQLQEWDETYKVDIFKSEDYTVSVQQKTHISEITISPSQLTSLQLQSPFSLDRYIWTKLKEHGVTFKDENGYGNYLDFVFR
ncbi:hypothetical protein [Virgibacillus sediminis]|uniref:Uncharacterized protein n=1 Tax=Virgibacillus sediminis TaxID=202260 RepID=A0ABV7A4I8_9BACI